MTVMMMKGRLLTDKDRSRVAVVGVTRRAMDLRRAALFRTATQDRIESPSMYWQQTSAVARLEIWAKRLDELSEPHHTGSSQRRVKGRSNCTNRVFACERITSVKWAYRAVVSGRAWPRMVTPETDVDSNPG